MLRTYSKVRGRLEGSVWWVRVAMHGGLLSPKWLRWETVPTLSGLLIHHVPRTQLNACWEAPKTPGDERRAAMPGPQQCPPGRAAPLASDVCPPPPPPKLEISVKGLQGKMGQSVVVRN